MKGEEFAQIFTKQMLVCEDILVNKAREYADDEDRLHNFKTAATLENVSVRQALAGMMAKHTVSVYDMCRSPDDFPIERWSEKITDHINYLILLQAIVQEDLNPTLFDS